MDISIQKVAMIVLAIIVVVAIVGAFTNSFKSMIDGFVSSVSFTEIS